ncbi:MAG: hypothetical protein AAF847_00120 [Bacteroidota bacterium]
MDRRRKLNRKEFLYLVREERHLYENLYIRRDLTAKKVAENQNIHYESWVNKVLHQVFGNKGKGHGGRRANSGNKKNIKFCRGCKKKIENCTGESRMCGK